MSESDLRELSMELAVSVAAVIKELKAQHETLICDNIGRSATSVGAEIYKADCAIEAYDYYSMLENALKEAGETGFWIELLYRTGYVNETVYRSLRDLCETIRLTLTRACSRDAEDGAQD